MKDVNNINVLKASDFDFPLPETLIAKKPAGKRDESRLLVLRKGGPIQHKRFYNLPDYLDKGDMLLLNNTRVFPARLRGVKPSGGNVEFLLVREICPDKWEILCKKRYSGKLSISEHMSAEITEGRIACFSYQGDFMENLWEYGDMPLPPYIKRRPDTEDKESYQTIYAEKHGSIAAPTAGLHFTGELINRLKDKGVRVRYITLHIGTGTFKPIRTENIEEHSMDSEFFEINADIISEIKKVKVEGKRVVSAGTTTTRAIEGYLSGRYSPIHPFTESPIHRICGYTGIFIYPGYEFKAVDSLITNFHLPRSTPLMLTSALCGFEKMKKTYAEAVERKYRFFSYGDAMLIL